MKKEDLKIQTIYKIMDFQLQLLMNIVNEDIFDNLDEDKRNTLRMNALGVIEYINLLLTNFPNFKNLESLLSIKERLFEVIKKLKGKPPIEEEMIVESKQADPWGIIESTKNLINNYSKSLDVLIPLFFFGIIEELHNKDIPPEAIRIPSITLRNIINKLLREAPYSQLLHKIYETSNIMLISEENAKIVDLVESYSRKFATKTSGSEYSSLIIDEAKMFLEAFNWGGSKTEKRIFQLIYEHALEHIKKAEKEKDAFRRAIHAATAILLCRISAALTQLPRIDSRLRKMKP